jgi:hypothetical protein
MRIPARFVHFRKPLPIKSRSGYVNCNGRDTVIRQRFVELPSCDVPESRHPFGITRAHGRSVGAPVCISALANGKGVCKSAGAVWVA